MKCKPILLALALAFAIPTQVKAQEPLVTPYEYVFLVSDSLEVDPYVMCALIDRESKWKLDAVSANGKCHGLCQIHQCWKDKATSQGFGDIVEDPYANIAYATFMIKNYLIEYNGDYNKALVKYNAGHLYADSSSYSRGILEKAEELKVQNNDVIY